MESASIAHDHHGPPPANQSSRVEAQFLRMLLFIISEVMLFGAFFTAYFFLRVVNHDPWPAEGTELPRPARSCAIGHTYLMRSPTGSTGHSSRSSWQPSPSNCCTS